MAESLVLPVNASRQEMYDALVPQLAALLETESDLVANLSNFVATIKEAFGFYWVGFYMVKEGELVLGPFQGPVACTRIGFDRGVCGHCYSSRKTVIVPDVDQFPGHIACSANSRSEIVVPVFNRNGQVAMVLDIDSERLDHFSSLDSVMLNKLVRLLERKI